MLASALVVIWLHCRVYQVQSPSRYRHGLLVMGAILVNERRGEVGRVQVTEAVPT